MGDHRDDIAVKIRLVALSQLSVAACSRAPRLSFRRPPSSSCGPDVIRLADAGPFRNEFGKVCGLAFGRGHGTAVCADSAGLSTLHIAPGVVGHAETVAYRSRKANCSIVHCWLRLLPFGQLIRPCPVGLAGPAGDSGSCAKSLALWPRWADQASARCHADRHPVGGRQARLALRQTQSPRRTDPGLADQCNGRSARIQRARALRRTGGYPSGPCPCFTSTPPPMITMALLARQAALMRHQPRNEHEKAG